MPPLLHSSIQTNNCHASASCQGLILAILQVRVRDEKGDEVIDHLQSHFKGQYVQYKHKDLMWDCLAATMIDVVVMEMELKQITVTTGDVRKVLSR